MTEETTPETKPNIVEQARNERELLEKINAETKANIEKFERMKAEDLLSGRSSAGSKQEEKKEMTPKEYIKFIDEKVRKREL